MVVMLVLGILGISPAIAQADTTEIWVRLFCEDKCCLHKRAAPKSNRSPIDLLGVSLICTQ
jgi:hypothetical protein